MLRGGITMVNSGSSPLARGLLGARRAVLRMLRIIPARAGFTMRGGWPALVSRDHPRSRGVYLIDRSVPSECIGSSPLARGLRGRRPAEGEVRGIIPARAGFTSPHPGPPAPCPDHPRSRGVYPVLSRLAGAVEGSSPLARGLPGGAGSCTHGLRIIPARAGFTRKEDGVGDGPADHPRSRGVYCPAGVPSSFGGGSSPLARGLPVRLDDFDDDARIIPARAGFTASLTFFSASWYGSSPLARGLRRRRQIIQRGLGIIPARAGFTICGGRMVGRGGDHPRSRGVYEDRAVVDAYVGGSSPLARGLRQHAGVLRRETRIIPARAGFTRRRSRAR